MKDNQGMELLEQGVMVFLFALGVSLMFMYLNTLNQSVKVMADHINQDKYLYQQYDLPTDMNNTMMGYEIIGIIRNGSEYPLTVNGRAVTDFGYLSDISYINPDAVYKFTYKIGTDGNIYELSFSI